tara:strand:- start:8169 stop:9023 length:855 start_codon:yes stop_codon:yes gene_type:complete
MSEVVYLADFFVEDQLAGGAEMSDAAIIEHLDTPIKRVRYNEIEEVDKDCFYIVANRSLFRPKILDKLTYYKNYIIVEHDYQFISGPGNGRNPYIFEGALVPPMYKSHLDFYKNAKAVFFQTEFQKGLFEKNNVEGNFISFGTTPYSNKEFSFFRKLVRENKGPRTRKFAVMESNNDIKNTKGAVDYCIKAKLDFDMIPPMKRESFLLKLAEYSALVFFPMTPESCSRLATEARVLGLNMITPQIYGAPGEAWFSLTGEDLVDELERITVEVSMPTLKEYLPNG